MKVKKVYSIGELKLLAVVWGLEKIRLYLLIREESLSLYRPPSTLTVE